MHVALLKPKTSYLRPNIWLILRLQNRITKSDRASEVRLLSGCERKLNRSEKSPNEWTIAFTVVALRTLALSRNLQEAL